MPPESDKNRLSVEEIRRRARSGPIYLLSRRGISAAISLVSTVTIARLLSPRDYGLTAMASLIFSFLLVFRDFGLTNATLRKGHVDEQEVSFLFWFNLAATATLAAIIALAAPFVAAFFKEPQVRNIILVSLIGFLIGGASLQHNALLRRDLRFRAVATIETCSQLFGFSVGLATALIRRDYWAIVAYGLAQSVMSSILNLAATRWRPRRPHIPGNVRELLSFGANTTLYSMLNFASRYTGPVIIGHWLGTVSLGHFNRAYNLFQLPMNNLLQPITQATLPVLARLRPYPEHYRVTYLGLVERLCCVLLPSSVGLAFAGVPLIHVLLGSKWDTAGVLLSALAPGLAVYGMIWPVSELLISQSRVKELRTIGLFDLVLRVAGSIVGASFGLVGAALGFTAATILMTPLRVGIAGRRGPVTALDQIRATLPSIPLAVGAAIGCGAARWGLSAFVSGSLGILAATVAGGLLGAVVCGAPFKATRRAVVNVVETITGRYKVASDQ